jgi:hypothetical protein
MSGVIDSYKLQIIEELEFMIMNAQKTGHSSLIPGLEKAITIVEETE